MEDNKKKKIGVLTVHQSLNYGAVLQAFALINVLQKNGYKAELIDYKSDAVYDREQNKHLGIKDIIKRILWRKKYKDTKIKQQLFYDFMNKYYKISDQSYDKNNIFLANNQYDYYITGSDQIWNFDITDEDTTFMLDFVTENSKKLSYAASFGYKELPKKYEQKTLKYLKNYKNILVREDTGKEIVENLGLIAHTVLDPTLLLTRDEWLSLVESEIIKEKYILVYTVAAPTYLMEFAHNLAKKTGIKIKAIKLEPEKELEDVEYIYNAGPREFIRLVRDAEYVLTTSFHGLAFSLNLKKEFFFEADTEKNSNMSRLINLAKLAQVMDRRIVDSEFNEKNKNDLDWNKIENSMRDARENSINKLLAMLE